MINMVFLISIVEILVWDVKNFRTSRMNNNLLIGRTIRLLSIFLVKEADRDRWATKF